MPTYRHESFTARRTTGNGPLSSRDFSGGKRGWRHRAGARPASGDQEVQRRPPASPVFRARRTIPPRNRHRRADPARDQGQLPRSSTVPECPWWVFLHKSDLRKALEVSRRAGSVLRKALCEPGFGSGWGTSATSERSAANETITSSSGARFATGKDPEIAKG